jgi:hypothetical protein
LFSKVTQSLITSVIQGKIMKQLTATWCFHSHICTFFKWHVAFHLPAYGYSEFLFFLNEALACYQLCVEKVDLVIASSPITFSILAYSSRD